MDVTRSPELLRLVEEIRQSGAGRVLTRDGEPLATIRPTRRSRRVHPAENATPDSLLNILGIGESAEPMDLAGHEQTYLAEAYERGTA
jgi:hypothetical protein